jgi:hypothetical protein
VKTPPNTAQTNEISQKEKLFNKNGDKLGVWNISNFYLIYFYNTLI